MDGWVTRPPSLANRGPRRGFDDVTILRLPGTFLKVGAFAAVMLEKLCGAAVREMLG